jgi:hypothetical protein
MSSYWLLNCRRAVSSTYPAPPERNGVFRAISNPIGEQCAACNDERSFRNVGRRSARRPDGFDYTHIPWELTIFRLKSSFLLFVNREAGRLRGGNDLLLYVRRSFLVMRSLRVEGASAVG